LSFLLTPLRIRWTIPFNIVDQYGSFELIFAVLNRARQCFFSLLLPLSEETGISSTLSKGDLGLYDAGADVSQQDPPHVRLLRDNQVHRSPPPETGGWYR
jgi:hypothetical protein